jgi:hypothetical protein
LSFNSLIGHSGMGLAGIQNDLNWSLAVFQQPQGFLLQLNVEPIRQEPEDFK